MSEDCYFFWDGEDVSYGDRKVYMQCVECHKESGKGIFWPARSGYPDIELRCNCGKIIHSPKQDED